ncbi:MAG: pyruvate formate-lyase-activating protein [Fibrobacteraceae bacterium]|nr:pyruvate formate-lyase-activating protein [Fibrobacteraceae bacterium]
MTSGYVHSFETGAASDGPGVRFALFVTGCPFRCLYCHNPDTWELERGQKKTSDEVLAEIGKYASFLRMAGGLTITGGEPLVQSAFVGEIFKRAKSELKLHTALDTNGFLGNILPDSWFDSVDLVLLDIKQINPQKHLELVGRPLEPVLEFAKRLNAMKKPVWIRHVLVPGYTDNEKDLTGLAEFLSTLQNIERVEVLPFHNMAFHKWEELKIPYKFKDMRPPSNEALTMARKILHATY